MLQIDTRPGVSHDPRQRIAAVQARQAFRLSDELRGATDETIEKSVAVADPIVLRGLVYQLTGDEDIAGMPMERVPYG